MAFIRSALIMIASHALHLTVLALVRLSETGTGRIFSSAARKIAAKPSLATSPHPGKTIGAMYPDDDFGKDYLTGLRDGLGDRAPLEQLQMMRFKGESRELFGPLMSGEKNS
jgi:hypothetical protein